MKNLYLSDIHLGNPFFESEEYIIKLLNNEYKKIFLVGDIIDEWEDDVGDIVRDYKDLIDKLNSLDNLIVIKGNHDPSLEDLKFIFPNAEVCDDYFDEDDNTLVVHGHEFDKLINKYNWLAKILYPIQWLFERFSLDLSYFFRNLFYSIAAKKDKKYYPKLVLDIEHKIVSTYTLYDNIIVGHTHFPKIVENKVDYISYINCGDWTHSCTYIEYNLEIKEFELKKGE
jgi:UDP-2,3-diacylglucosamine pyrophosphatase LpxH